MKSSVADILSRLMQRQGLGESALARAAGVPQPTIHRILSGASTDPKTGTLRHLADYFGLTVAQLRGDEPLHDVPGPEQTYSVAERALIAQFRQLTDEEQRVIRRTVAALVQARAAGMK